MRKIKQIATFCPSISTENLGDFIIENYCNKVLKNIFGECMMLSVPTRDHLSKLSRRKVAKSDYSFVLGTNILSSKMNEWKQWNISIRDAYLIRYGDVRKKELFHLNIMREKKENTHVVLLGAGWFDYQTSPNAYTRCLLQTLLDNNIIHSVRDSYTEQMLKKAGINNVVNTACPTMWRLTEEFCKEIPHKKSDSVITTLTDYRVNPKKDLQLINILKDNYKHVFIWLQSLADYDYLQRLNLLDQVEIIMPTLDEYDRVLEEYDIDYIGTRLHGGIRALNHKKRSCILSVDNRANEIAKDTNLPVISREKVETELEDWIQSEQETMIKLPQENINKWKAQFER